MPRLKSIRSCRTMLAVLAAAGLAWTTSGCQGPEEITETNRLSATNGDSYEVNLIMLSELSGRILPQKGNKITIEKREKTDENGATKIHYYTKNNNDADDSETDIDNIIEDQTKLPSGILSNDLKDRVIFINPYKIDSKDKAAFEANTIPCIYKAEDSEKKITEYECQPYYSGIKAIERIWNEYFDNGHPNTLRIGNGDSFGVTNGFSRDNKDRPTMFALNQLKFSYDTFGNHSFDNQGSLETIQNHLNDTNVRFTISNLANIIRNLYSVSTYEIADIESENGDAEPLHIGIVGVLDETSGETTTVGNMGTLQLTDYCETIYKLEEAYNKNARAFIILTHVFSYKPYNLISFFSTLYDGLYLDDACPDTHLIITESMLSNGKTAKSIQREVRRYIYDSILAIFNEDIESPVVAHISNEALEGMGKFLNANKGSLTSITNDNLFINAIADSNSNNKDLKIGVEIKKYINETLGVHLDNLFDDYYSIVSETLDPSMFSLGKYQQYSIDQYESEGLDQLNYADGLTYIQIPGKGAYTLNIKYALNMLEGALPYAGDSSTAPHYSKQMLRVRLEPVLSKGDMKLQADKESVSLTEIHDQPTCDIVMKGLNNTLDGCQDYYDKYKERLEFEFEHKDEENEYNEQMASINKEIKEQHDELYKLEEKLIKTSNNAQRSELKSQIQDVKNNINRLNDELEKLNNTIYKTLEEPIKKLKISDFQDKCFRSIQSETLSNHKKSPKDDLKLETDDLAEVFTCLYNLSLWEYDSNESQKYFKQNICEFKDDKGNIYTVGKEDGSYEIRKFSSFITNMTADILLQYSNTHSSQNAPYDLIIVNAGSVRDTFDFSEIDTEFVKSTFPYPNNPYWAEMKAEDIHKMLNHGLNTKTDGGFPLIAGINLSYVEVGSQKNITQIWLVDSKQKPKKLIYFSCVDGKPLSSRNEKSCLPKSCNDGSISSDDGGCNCILGIKEGGKCTLGDLTLNGDQVNWTINDKGDESFFKNEDLSNQYKIIIPDYLSTGGDSYPVIDVTYTPLDSNMTSNDIFIDALKKYRQYLQDKGKTSLECGYPFYDENNEDKINYRNTIDTITTNLKKRIYTIDTVSSGNTEYHTDYPSNSCVATQEMLYKSITEKEKIISCSYPQS